MDGGSGQYQSHVTSPHVTTASRTPTAELNGAGSMEKRSPAMAAMSRQHVWDTQDVRHSYITVPFSEPPFKSCESICYFSNYSFDSAPPYSSFQRLHPSPPFFGSPLSPTLSLLTKSHHPISLRPLFPLCHLCSLPRSLAPLPPRLHDPQKMYAL